MSGDAMQARWLCLSWPGGVLVLRMRAMPCSVCGFGRTETGDKHQETMFTSCFLYLYNKVYVG